jgi:export-related chaperone CsaA
LKPQAHETLTGAGQESRRMSLSIDDFRKVEMRVGKILSVEDIPSARKPMYKISIDFGNGVSKQCVAGIKDHYTKDDLAGKIVVAVVNLEPKSVAGVVSECMLLAAYNETKLSLLCTDREVPLGVPVS